MRITRVQIFVETIHLNKPFRVSLGTIDAYRALLVRVHTDEGLTGVGEGSPLGIITGETIEGSIAAARLFADHLPGRDPLDIGGAHRMMDALIYANPSAKAAVDMALYDISARREGKPLYRFLGGSSPVLHNDITIAMDSGDMMVREALRHVRDGFTFLKIKVGGPPEEDIANVRAIRRAVGSGVRLHLDANQGWTPAQAVSVLAALSDCSIGSVEQPVPRWDLEGLARVRQSVGIPVIADEAVFTPQDAAAAIRREAVSGINIKLMKCGGIYRARQISALARQRDVFCMCGCMMDTVLGLTAAASFSASDSNVRMVDLDSVFHIRPGGIRGGIRFEGGLVTLSDGPGLDVDF